MPHDRKRPDRDVSGKNVLQELDRTLSDPDTWSEPPSYVELLTHPSVQSRIARLIVQSALKRQRGGRRPHPHGA